MSTHEPLSPQERELAARLASWQVAAPSPEIEQAILARARAAAAAGATAGNRRPPWLVSLASAAVLVLGLGVVWRVMEAPPADGPFTETSPIGGAPAVMVIEESATPAVGSAERRAAVMAAEDLAPPAADATTGGRSRVGIETPAPASRSQRVQGPPPSSAMAATGKGAMADTAAEPIASRPQAAPDRAAAVRRGGVAATPQAAPETPAPTIEPADTRPAAGAAPPVVAGRRAGAVGPAPAAPDAPDAPVSAAVPAPPPPPAAITPPPASMPMEPVAAPPPAPAVKAATAPARNGERSSMPDPDARGEGAGGQRGRNVQRLGSEDDVAFASEISRIRALIERGERDKVPAELEKLQRRFPDKVLPGDLRALIEKPDR